MRCRSLKKQIGFLGVVLMLGCIGTPGQAFAEQSGDSDEWTYVSSSVPYELVGQQLPPETAVVLLKDERTGEDYERELPRREVIEKDRVWKDDFFFSLTVSGYDADMFLLGETEVPAEADLALYGDALLEYLGLPKECYKVNQVEWNGESYECDGVLCRDALASGERLVRYVDVKYGGQVRMPDVPEEQPTEAEIVLETETEAESTEETTAIRESEEETETAEIQAAERESWRDRLGKWIREHLTVVKVSLIFLIGLILALVLFLVSGKKKKSRD